MDTTKTLKESSNRGCYKQKYKTKKKAIDVCLNFFIKYGWYNTPYHCNRCKQYHLTTHPNKGTEPSKRFIEGFNKWFGSKVL